MLVVATTVNVYCNKFSNQYCFNISARGRLGQWGVQYGFIGIRHRQSKPDIAKLQ